MLKTLLAATTALTLISGASFAQGYSDSTTKTTTGVATPLGDVGVSKTTRSTGNSDGTTVEKEKTVHHDAMMGERDKTVTKDTDVSANGDVARRKTESTTIR
jgi:hypothetical protein